MQLNLSETTFRTLWGEGGSGSYQSSHPAAGSHPVVIVLDDDDEDEDEDETNDDGPCDDDDSDETCDDDAESQVEQEVCDAEDEQSDGEEEESSHDQRPSDRYALWRHMWQKYTGFCGRQVFLFYNSLDQGKRADLLTISEDSPNYYSLQAGCNIMSMVYIHVGQQELELALLHRMQNHQDASGMAEKRARVLWNVYAPEDKERLLADPTALWRACTPHEREWIVWTLAHRSDRSNDGIEPHPTEIGEMDLNMEPTIGSPIF